MRFFLADSVSCTSSRATVQKYADQLLSRGMVAASTAEDADLILIDTCAFDKASEDQSLRLIESQKKIAKNSAKVIACGCLAAISPQKLQGIDTISTVLGDVELQPSVSGVRGSYLGKRDLGHHPFVKRWMLRSWSAFVNREAERFIPFALIRRLAMCTQLVNPNAYAIQISEGCLGNCSFCAIPQSKGRTRSEPLPAIVMKVSEVVKRGVRRIVLTSEDTGAYGKDCGSSFISLLEEIHKIDGDFTIHLQNMDPRWLAQSIDLLLPIIAKEKIKHLEIPVQSGSDSILRSMQRAYQMEHVLPALRRLRREFPRLGLSTHFITGFPGETERDFEGTRSLIAESIFDWVIVFPYSARPNTKAATMLDSVPEELKLRRTRKLQNQWRRSLVTSAFA